MIIKIGIVPKTEQSEPYEPDIYLADESERDLLLSISKALKIQINFMHWERHEFGLFMLLFKLLGAQVEGEQTFDSLSITAKVSIPS